MELAAQILFISYALLSASAGFAMIGKTPTSSKSTELGLTFFVYGGLTIMLLLTWGDSAAGALAALLVLLWFPVVVDLFSVNKPRKAWPLRSAVFNAVNFSIMIGLALLFWI